jgi:hypothetical protein
VVGVLNSLLKNSKQASRLRILALAPVGAEASFKSYLECHGLHPAQTIHATNDTTSTLRIAGFKGRIKARVAGGFNLAGEPLAAHS